MNRSSSSTYLLALLCWLIGVVSSARADERTDFFESKIRPVLVETCFRCHGDLKTSAGLRVDRLASLTEGGDSGPAVIPGKPEESPLLLALKRDEGVAAMPPEREKALRPDQVEDFTRWIRNGAAWPENSGRFEARRHWAFEPTSDPQPPEVRDRAWPLTSIDRFVLARLESAGLEPAPPADKRTLIRRATFDLTGLPPTPDEVDAFLADNSPRSFETVVERLLASPAYGERWGRHWLDVVRYADTAGETADYPVPLAWRYRNYVINAFNTDKPYNAFLREQIAGDILGAEGPPDLYAERAAATGYLAISRRFGFDSENYHHLTIQDTIDTLGQSVLGLSLGCARCHDHKFDPVSTREYYALYGIFDSTRYAFPGSEQKQKTRAMLPLMPPRQAQAAWRAHEARLRALAAQLAALGQPVPGAMLRSLHEIDGDFELQAPAAGGSNGVLVPPWLYRGKIAVTNAAQSPFQNVYRPGRVGANIAVDSGPYQITQALDPPFSEQTAPRIEVNLDFKVNQPAAAGPSPTGRHRFLLGPVNGQPLVEVSIGANTLQIQSDGSSSASISVPAGAWRNLRLTLDLAGRTVSGSVRGDDSTELLAPLTLPNDQQLSVGLVAFESEGGHPGIELDNLAVQEGPLGDFSTPAQSEQGPDAASLNAELKTLVGIDGDLELQAADTPPSTPWNPGPNSVVKVLNRSQSPYRNIYPAGRLGIHAPNRGEYDGFGLTLPDLKPGEDGKLHASLDFRCADQQAGGGGSWRYYLGHGAGNSAAVELFFNGSTFFRKSGGSIDPVGPIEIGRWYQVQVSLDLKQKTYSGSLASDAGTISFTGELASNWDGLIDYTFVDSYGHLGGVRPAIDIDQFAISGQPFPAINQPATELGDSGQPVSTRREQVAALRTKLAEMQASAAALAAEYRRMLAEGPAPMAYGVVEGTPHDAVIQQRGEPDRPGEQVRRGFLNVLGGQPLPPDARGSGRRELADWLTKPQNPLTARVMVNRIWQYHFGRGLVQTPNDFGVRGMPPTDPALLDHLATRFVREGWSIKAMHRLIMNSSTYQQAAVASASDSSDSPAGFPSRRLSAEEIRDAILLVAGTLDRSPANGHPFPSPLDWGYSQHGPFLAVYDHNKRGIYLMSQRLKRHPFLGLFDGADPNASTAERRPTTVPTQALFFLNDPLIHATSEAWAGRLMAASPTEPERIEEAWRQALGRSPSAAERAEAESFLSAYQAELAAGSAPAMKNSARLALAAYLRTLLASNEFLHLN